MWVAEIKVWPYGDHTRPMEMVSLAACNTGTSGTLERGNYAVLDVTGTDPETWRAQLLQAMSDNDPDVVWVTGWPRGEDQGHLSSLVGAVLDAMSVGQTRIINGE